jgi:hypothetical protein
MSTEQQQTAVTKKHVRSRGRSAKSKEKTEHDPYDSAYGRVPWEMFRGRPWTYPGKLDESMVGNRVLLLGSVMGIWQLGKTRTVVVLFSRSRTVRCAVAVGADEGVTTRMVRFAATLRRGTYVDVEGVIGHPGTEAGPLGLMQPVEIQVRRLYAIGTNKDGSIIDGVNTTEDDSPTVDGVTTTEDGGLVAVLKMSISAEQQHQETAVTGKHIGSRGRSAKPKEKIAQDPYDSAYGRVPWVCSAGGHGRTPKTSTNPWWATACCSWEA